MRSLTRLVTLFALMLAMTGIQVQPLQANAVPAPGQGGAVTTCTAPYITSVVIVWNPDGSGNRTTYWSQTCTTTFTSADGTTTTTSVTHSWVTHDFIPAPNPVPVKPDTQVVANRGEL
ncbi:MAG TPA: hypothetical protein VF006_02295 [Longimicrobium sp.]